MHLNDIKDVVSRQVSDVEDLVSLLELTVDDILDRFPDRLVENQEKFGIYETGE